MRIVAYNPVTDHYGIQSKLAEQLELCRVNDAARSMYPNRTRLLKWLHQYRASNTALEVRVATDYLLLKAGCPVGMHHGDYQKDDKVNVVRSTDQLGVLGVPELLPNHNVPYENTEYRHWTVVDWTPEMGVPVVGHKHDWTHLTLLVNPKCGWPDDPERRLNLLHPLNSAARPGEEWGATMLTVVWLDQEASGKDLGLCAWTNRPDVRVYKDEAALMHSSVDVAQYMRQLKQLMLEND